MELVSLTTMVGLMLQHHLLLFTTHVSKKLSILKHYYVNTTTDDTVTIIGCNFTNNSGFGVSIIGMRPTPKLLISYCTFADSTNFSLVCYNINVNEEL